MTRATGLLLAVFAAVLLSSCAHLDWEAAQLDHTSAGYKSFIAAHPKSPHIREAKKRAERVAYEEACNLNTIEAYEVFLKNYPDGRCAKAAKTRMAELMKRQNDGLIQNNSRKTWKPALVIERLKD